MIEWERILLESPINWLLDKSNPSVRYFTMRDILDKNENDAELLEAKQAIPSSRVVEKILQKQSPEGYWEEPDNPYHPKYKSSYWQVMMLGQLGMQKTDERTERACENMFRLQSADGSFSSYTLNGALEEYERLKQKGKELLPIKEFKTSLVHEHEYSCLTGNMVAALNRIGYEDDPRTAKALEWLVKIQNKDGGWLCPYWRAHVSDKHGCFFGTICPLEAFSTVDRRRLTMEMRETVERGAEFLLMHRLFKADHHGYKTVRSYWLTLSFPMFTGYSTLRGLDVLTRLGYVKDIRLNDAVEILLQKRQEDGTWMLENSPVGRMQTKIEAKGKPSKWITLIALRTLKRLESL
jgi:hypothetical protein